MSQGTFWHDRVEFSTVADDSVATLAGTHAKSGLGVFNGDSARCDRVGTMFGPYELQSLIGVGGMGEVYRAYDTARDRKVCTQAAASGVGCRSRLPTAIPAESRVAARLQEPHVIPVHDWGDIGGVLFIDMRLVEGTNLKTLLAENGPLEPARAASIITQVAAALDAAHADGLVHRDIKPENILLTPTDFAYLADFGIAHLGGDSGLTSAGAAIGSCTYMAPERFNGGRIGPQSDVYSLTCVLYECLTGRPPFEGEVSRPIERSHARYATAPERGPNWPQPFVRRRDRPRAGERPSGAVPLRRRVGGRGERSSGYEPPTAADPRVPRSMA